VVRVSAGGRIQCIERIIGEVAQTARVQALPPACFTNEVGDRRPGHLRPGMGPLTPLGADPAVPFVAFVAATIVAGPLITDLVVALRFGTAVVRWLLFVHDPILRRGYDKRGSKQRISPRKS